MSTMNRLGNAGNNYQTRAKRVLCLCSAGLLRSPTAANVLHREYGFNTRAAGVSEDFALVVVDPVLLRWADEVVCLEQRVKDELDELIRRMELYPDTASIVVLDVPDHFEWNDTRLQQIIKEQYAAQQENYL